jgi:hypothetical protein
MAIVLQHKHVCPACEDVWRCTCWTCDVGFDELICDACKLAAQDAHTHIHKAPTDTRHVIDFRGDVVPA